MLDYFGLYGLSNHALVAYGHHFFTQRGGVVCAVLGLEARKER